MNERFRRPIGGHTVSEIPFHATRMGQRFYDHTMPKLVEELARVNASLAELINVLD